MVPGQHDAAHRDIDDARRHGKSDDEIREGLRLAGWHGSDTDALMAGVAEARGRTGDTRDMGRVIGAALLGVAAFFAFGMLSMPFMLMSWPIDPFGPPDVYFVLLSCGSAVAVLAGLLLAPKYRWEVTALTLAAIFLLISGNVGFYSFKLAGHTPPYSAPAQWWMALLLGITLAVLTVALAGPRATRRTYGLVLCAVVLVSIGCQVGATALHRRYVQRIENDLLPQVETFVSESVCPDLGQMKRYTSGLVFIEGNAGVHSTATATPKGLWVTLTAPLPLDTTSQAGMPPGCSEVMVVVNRTVESTPQGEALREWLLSLGYSPDLVGILENDGSGRLVATHDGTRYEASVRDGWQTIVKCTPLSAQ